MIAIIAAVTKNGVIGSKGGLPWYIPEDLKRFKSLTTGKTVVMGRKTFESIIQRLGHPLPNRMSVVITKQADYKVPPGVIARRSPEDALRGLSGDVFIIGGGEIYAQTINMADTLYITHVDKEVEGDVCFPPFSTDDWRVAEEEKHDGYRFTVYRRKTDKE